jgi:hypothetical protein
VLKPIVTATYTTKFGPITRHESTDWVAPDSPVPVTGTLDNTDSPWSFVPVGTDLEGAIGKARDIATSATVPPDTHIAPALAILQATDGTFYATNMVTPRGIPQIDGPGYAAQGFGDLRLSPDLPDVKAVVGQDNIVRF